MRQVFILRPKHTTHSNVRTPCGASFAIYYQEYYILNQFFNGRSPLSSQVMFFDSCRGIWHIHHNIQSINIYYLYLAYALPLFNYTNANSLCHRARFKLQTPQVFEFKMAYSTIKLTRLYFAFFAWVFGVVFYLPWLQKNQPRFSIVKMI